MKKILACGILVSTFMALIAFGQPQAQPADFDKMLETMRADARADKAEIVKELMRLTPRENERFWPVYRRYETEVTKLNDQRLKIIRDYADQLGAITDKQAKALVERMFAWETRRTQLRKTYFSEFARATSGVTAAKFFQIEHRLDLLVDLLVASGVPGLYEQQPERARK